MFAKSFAPAAALLVITACSTSSSAQSHRLGTIDFPTSGSIAAKPHFIRGVLFLHSFEYDSAALEFRKAQAADSAFALAYWGEAMTHTHPVWNEQDLVAARGILQRLGDSEAARKARAPTHREQMYLDAVEILYGDGSKEKRDTLYSDAMKRIVDAHPEDTEAKAFYALSLIGLSQGVRSVETYVRAGRIAEEIFKSNPDHPGAAHYVIHAYDDPSNAARGLAAARAYSKIAPGAAHAQHMTTHIFLALGMWDDVVSQNEIASGHDHDAWRPGHYTQWLNYAYLQQGRYTEALQMLDRMKAPTTPRGQWALTSMRARYLIETEQWDAPIEKWNADAATLGTGGGPEWVFVTGFRAAKRRDVAAVAKAVDDMKTLSAAGESDAIMEMELAAILRYAEEKKDEALSMMRDATRKETAMAVEFGPPVVIKPSHELYGEMLLDAGKPGEAHAAFSRALELTPKRARSLLGLARAAKAMGNSAGAARAFADIDAVWHRADAAVKANRGP
jgi:tetratricopeptide (TPR) repeat protein